MQRVQALPGSYRHSTSPHFTTLHQQAEPHFTLNMWSCAHASLRHKKYVISGYAIKTHALPLT